MPADGVVVDLVVTKFDAGSSTARLLVGAGAGASYLLTDIKLSRGGKVIAEFTLDATSSARGGWRAIGRWLNRHVGDSVRILVSQLTKAMQ